jgi:hypothetical protein
LTHGVSHGLRNSDETPSSQHFQAFCPVLRPYAVPESIKGEPTIKILKLDREDLNEWRLKHLQNMKLLFQFVKSSASLPQNKNLRDLVAKAEKNLQDAISDKGEFAAATRAALQDQFKFVSD